MTVISYDGSGSAVIFTSSLLLMYLSLLSFVSSVILFVYFLTLLVSNYLSSWLACSTMSASLINSLTAGPSSIEFAIDVCKKVWLGVRVECTTDILNSLSGCVVAAVVVVRHVNELLSLLLGQWSWFYLSYSSSSSHYYKLLGLSTPSSSCNCYYYCNCYYCKCCYFSAEDTKDEDNEDDDDDDYTSTWLIWSLSSAVLCYRVLDFYCYGAWLSTVYKAGSPICFTYVECISYTLTMLGCLCSVWCSPLSFYDYYSLCKVFYAFTNLSCYLLFGLVLVVIAASSWCCFCY